MKKQKNKKKKLTISTFDKPLAAPGLWLQVGQPERPWGVRRLRCQASHAMSTFLLPPPPKRKLISSYMSIYCWPNDGTISIHQFHQVVKAKRRYCARRRWVGWNNRSFFFSNLPCNWDSSLSRCSSKTSIWTARSVSETASFFSSFRVASSFMPTNSLRMRSRSLSCGVEMMMQLMKATSAVLYSTVGASRSSRTTTAKR